jgi:hypothetical protein
MPSEEVPVVPYSRDIAIFLGFFAVLGLADFLLGFLGFTLFAVIGIVFTYFFTERWATLDRHQVDVWYYSLAVLGLISFFYSGFVSEEQYVNRLHIAESKDRLAELEEIESNPRTYFAKFENRRPILDQYEELFAIVEARYGEIVHDCQGENAAESPYCQRRDRISYIASIAVPINESINTGRDYLSREDVDEAFGNLSIELYPTRTLTFERGAKVRANELYWFFQPYRREWTRARDFEARKTEYEQQEAERVAAMAATLVADERTYLANLELIREELTQNGRMSFNELLSRNLWPYFLCVALLMKLARGRVAWFDPESWNMLLVWYDAWYKRLNARK